jgi:hypothetical protein
VIPERQKELERFIREHFPEPPCEPGSNGRARSFEPSLPLEDEEVIEKCRKAKNGAKFGALFDDGNTSGYGSASEADVALISRLAFYTQNEDQLDRLFRRSALMRSKWERHDYRKRTIDFALSSLGETYHPPQDKRYRYRHPYSESNGNGATESPKKARPRIPAVRFGDLPKPQPTPYVVDGLIPEGHPAMFYGDGGVAKSYVAMDLAMAVSRGAGTFLGRPTTKAPVVYLDFELDADVQSWRASRLARAEGLREAPEDLLYMCALGARPRDAFADALEACKEHGAKLLIADSLSIALEGDVEYARDVIAFYQHVIGPFRGAGVAVLGLDHQSKLQPGERYQNKRAFGSVFKSNLARSVIQIEATERGEDVLTLRLRQVKHNFGALVQPFGAQLWFEPDKVTVRTVDLADEDLAAEGTLNARDRVMLALDGLGEGTPNEIAELTPGLVTSTVKKELSKLRKAGEVEETGEVRDRQQVVRRAVTVTNPFKGNGNSNGGEAASEPGLWEGAL